MRDGREVWALGLVLSLSLSLEVNAGPVVRAPASTQHKLFRELTAVHPFGPTGPVECDADGTHVFAAEGCAIAFLDASCEPRFENDETCAGGPGLPSKRIGISSRGVLGCELLLDPNADLSDPQAPNRLYVAGGRDGLWVMRADPGFGSPNPAARIDDAWDAADLAGQGSRRWCHDLETISIGGESYLLALFAARSDTHLRLYSLVQLRSIPLSMDPANPSPETGNEVLPVVDLALPSNPAWVHPGPGGDPFFAEAYGYGVCSHGSDAYVALGAQGLIRVSFDPQHLSSPSITAGPYFGDGSTYHNNGGVGGQHAELYGDLSYIDPQSGMTEMRHPPLFVDVVATSVGASSFVIAAVDHLGWVAFDVTTPSAWSSSMPIAHHEGAIQTDLQGAMRTSLVDPSVESDERTYARRLDVGVTPGVGRVLAVASHVAPAWREPGLLSEGRQLGPAGDTLAGIGAGELDRAGRHPYLLLYRLDSSLLSAPTSYQAQPTSFARVGGGRVRMPPQQAQRETVVFGARVMNAGFGGGGTLDPGEAPVPAVGADGPNSTFRYELDWTDPNLSTIDLWVRQVEMRPGRNFYDLGFSPGRPEVLQTSGNDASLIAEPALIECGGEIHPAGLDTIAHGVVWNPGATWLRNPPARDVYVLVRPGLRADERRELAGSDVEVHVDRPGAVPVRAGRAVHLARADEDGLHQGASRSLPRHRSRILRDERPGRGLRPGARSDPRWRRGRLLPVPPGIAAGVGRVSA